MENKNDFLTSNVSLIVTPKTLPIHVFNYRTIADLQNLIEFVGKEPRLKVEKGVVVIQFGKKELKDKSIILRNSYGEVIDSLTYEKANELFDIKAESEFLPEQKNKVTAKPKRAAKAKATKK